MNMNNFLTDQINGTQKGATTQIYSQIYNFCEYKVQMKFTIPALFIFALQQEPFSIK